MIRVVVLGAGAGGGFPQWNSNAPACRRARAGDDAARPRTQCSVAVSGDGAHWFVLNAAPDLRVQMERTVELHPREGLRSTPIAGVALAGAEVDAIAGLLTLREGQAFRLYAAAPTLAQLDANPIFDVVRRDIVPRMRLEPEVAVPLLLADGRPSGLDLTAIPVPGKVPLYMEHRLDGQDVAGDPAETVALQISDGRARLVFMPGCAHVPAALRARVDGADCLMFDATLWDDEEMRRAGLGPKRGADMGHMSVHGPDGAIAAWQGARIGRRVLIHINNSNPVLLADSPERRVAEQAGWQVGEDGMRFTL